MLAPPNQPKKIHGSYITSSYIRYIYCTKDNIHQTTRYDDTQYFFKSLMILPQLNLFLDEEDIMDDLRIINKVSGKPVSKKVTPHPSPIEPIIAEAKIDDGRLYYDKRW